MHLRLRFLLAKLIGRWNAMKISCEFRLLDLPNELIVLVLEYVESKEALRHLASTSRRMNSLVEPILYRHLVLGDRPGAECVLEAFDCQARRTHLVQKLDLPCKPRLGPEISSFAELLCRTPNLKEMMFEGPECNSGHFEPPDEWEEMTDHLLGPLIKATPVGGLEPSRRPLQKLSKLTIHMNGGRSPYWTLDSRSIHILYHPTLQDLTISCVNINKTCNVDPDLFGTTPLKNLNLIECNITLDGLANILKLPQALEELYLGENCHNVRAFSDYEVNPASNYLFERTPGATIDTIALQKDSLQSLTYVTTSNYYQPDQRLFSLPSRSQHVHGGFSRFPILKTVALHGQCPNFERAVLSSTPPPNLERLEYQSYLKSFLETPASFETGRTSIVPFLRAPSSAVPASLKHISVCIESEYPDHTPDSLKQSDKDHFKEAHKSCQALGLTMEFYYQIRTNHLPPFLWQEPLPTRELIYAGGDSFLGRLARERSQHNDAYSSAGSDYEDDDDSSDEDWAPESE